MATFTARMNDKLIADLDRIAAARRTSRNREIEAAITVHIAQAKRFSPEETRTLLDVAVGKYASISWVRAQAAFALRGAEGMAIHRYLSPDWAAANELWSAACNAIMEMLVAAGHKSSIEKTMTDQIAAAVKRRYGAKSMER